MGRIVDQNVKSTFKMTTGASVTSGDLLYANASDFKVLPLASQTPSFTSYTDTVPTTFTNLNTNAVNGNTVKVCNLVSGDYVIAYTTTSGGYFVKFQRYNSSGVAQGSLTTVDTTISTTLSIAPLSGGGFVIAYNDGAVTTNPRFAVYNSTGTQTVAPTMIENVTTSTIAAEAMTSGGFVVVYNAGTTNLKYGYYNVSGVLQGSLTSIVAGDFSAVNNMHAKQLSDGQIAVGYRDASFNIYIAHINSSGAISVASAPKWAASGTSPGFVRICPTTNGSYVLCYVQATYAQNKVISSTGVLTPSQWSTIATSGATTVTFPNSLNLNTTYSIEVAPNSVAGGGTMTITNGTSSYYYRFDNQGCQIGEIVGITGNSTTFRALGIAANGNDTWVTYVDANNYPSFTKFSATTNTNITPAYITQNNNVLSPVLTLASPTPSYTTNNTLGKFSSCILNSGDIVSVTQNNSYTYGCHLTVFGSDGVIKFQKWVWVDGGNTLNEIGVASLSNGGFVVVTTNSGAGTGAGQFAYIYSSTAQYVTTIKIDVIGTTSNNISVIGLVNGGFAVAYQNTSTGTKYAVYANDGTTIASPTNIAQYNNSQRANSIAAMVDGGFVIALLGSTGITYVQRFAATGVAVSTLTNTSGTSGVSVSVVGTSDNGFGLLKWQSSFAIYLQKYNSGSLSPAWSIVLVGGSPVPSQSYDIRLTYCSTNGYFVATYYNSGLSAQYFFKVNLAGYVLNGGTITVSGQALANSTLNSITLLPKTNDNVIILSGYSGYFQYLTFSQGYTLVGVAAESASTNTEIDVIVDGVTYLNKSWYPTTVNTLSNIPTGIKGVITGTTAELTRQRNNLA